MDQPYSFLADWLSKFHMASEPIQALWIVAVTLVILGTCWTLTTPFRLWLTRRFERLGTPRLPGELLYGVFFDAEGRWLVYAEGEVRVLDERGLMRLEGRESVREKGA